MTRQKHVNFFNLILEEKKFLAMLTEVMIGSNRTFVESISLRTIMSVFIRHIIVSNRRLENLTKINLAGDLAFEDSASYVNTS